MSRSPCAIPMRSSCCATPTASCRPAGAARFAPIWKRAGSAAPSWTRSRRRSASACAIARTCSRSTCPRRRRRGRTSTGGSPKSTRPRAAHPCASAPGPRVRVSGTPGGGSRWRRRWRWSRRCSTSGAETPSVQAAAATAQGRGGGRRRARPRRAASRSARPQAQVTRVLGAPAARRRRSAARGAVPGGALQLGRPAQRPLLPAVARQLPEEARRGDLRAERLPHPHHHRIGRAGGGQPEAARGRTCARWKAGWSSATASGWRSRRCPPKWPAPAAPAPQPGIAANRPPAATRRFPRPPWARNCGCWRRCTRWAPTWATRSRSPAPAGACW